MQRQSKISTSNESIVSMNNLASYCVYRLGDKRRHSYIVVDGYSPIAIIAESSVFPDSFFG